MRSAQPTKRQTDKSRAAIKTTQLINRLQDHVQGKVQLDSSQVQSIRILLGKSLPDLTSTEFTDVTPDHGNAQEIEAMYRQAVIDTIQTMPIEELQAIREQVILESH